MDFNTGLYCYQEQWAHFEYGLSWFPITVQCFEMGYDNLLPIPHIITVIFACHWMLHNT